MAYFYDLVRAHWHKPADAGYGNHSPLSWCNDALATRIAAWKRLGVDGVLLDKMEPNKPLV